MVDKIIKAVVEKLSSLPYIEGIVTANYQTGHPRGYISAMYRGELAISKVLYNKNSGFNEMKGKAEIYPTVLKKRNLFRCIIFLKMLRLQQ